jgi:hypothetical protein
MGFVEALLLAFIILKLTGAITWAWWLVISPIYLDVIVYLVVFTVGIKFWRKHKQNRAEIDEYWADVNERFPRF